MSTHEIVTALLCLMDLCNCCTNILNLIACNVVSTQLSVPMRGAVAWIIQNSRKPKIIYLRLGRPTLDSGLQIHLSNRILLRQVGKFIFIWLNVHCWERKVVEVDSGCWKFSTDSHI